MLYSAKWGENWRRELKELCPELTEKQVWRYWRRLVKRWVREGWLTGQRAEQGGA